MVELKSKNNLSKEVVACVDRVYVNFMFEVSPQVSFTSLDTTDVLVLDAIYNIQFSHIKINRTKNFILHNG